MTEQATDYTTTDWWGRVEAFIATIPSISFLGNHGEIDPEWKMFETRAAAWDAAGADAWDAARVAARTDAWDAAGDAAWDAVRADAWEAAGDAAWDAVRADAWDAAGDAAGDAAWDAAGDAAWDAALVASILVCDGLPLDQEHIDYAWKRWRIWESGYGVVVDVDGVFYVYRREVLMTAEPTLHERPGLASIIMRPLQAEIERLEAELRERVAEYDARIESADTRLAKAEKAAETLAWKNAELKKVAVELSKHCDDWMNHYAALKARADALRDAGDRMKEAADNAYFSFGSPLEPHSEWRPLGDASFAWSDLSAAYDAADRAGETPTPEQVEALDGLAEDAIRAHRAGETTNIHDLAAPIPTDAAAEDLEKKYAEHDISWTPDGMQTQIEELREQVNDLVQRADASHTRLNFHKERIHDIARWRANMDRWQESVDFHMTHIRKFRDSMVPALAKANLRILSLEQRLDALHKGVLEGREEERHLHVQGTGWSPYDR